MYTGTYHLISWNLPPDYTGQLAIILILIIIALTLKLPLPWDFVVGIVSFGGSCFLHFDIISASQLAKILGSFSRNLLVVSAGGKST